LKLGDSAPPEKVPKAGADGDRAPKAQLPRGGVGHLVACGENALLVRALAESSG
jgi:hypothetical protein